MKELKNLFIPGGERGGIARKRRGPKHQRGGVVRKKPWGVRKNFKTQWQKEGRRQCGGAMHGDRGGVALVGRVRT